MGIDKGGIVVHGKTQREYLLQEFSAIGIAVSTSCRADQSLQPHLHPIIDSFSIDSPLNGILSAFQFSKENAWLAVAVDMPYVDRSVLQLLIDNRDTNKMATCFFNNATELPEPLLTIWEPAAFPLLLAFSEAGSKSPRDFLAAHPVKMIQPSNPRIFYNMNMPSDIV